MWPIRKHRAYIIGRGYTEKRPLLPWCCIPLLLLQSDRGIGSARIWASCRISCFPAVALYYLHYFLKYPEISSKICITHTFICLSILNWFIHTTGMLTGLFICHYRGQRSVLVISLSLSFSLPTYLLTTWLIDSWQGMMMNIYLIPLNQMPFKSTHSSSWFNFDTLNFKAAVPLLKLTQFSKHASSSFVVVVVMVAGWNFLSNFE